jgi:hypothetical protein
MMVVRIAALPVESSASLRDQFYLHENIVVVSGCTMNDGSD